MRRVKERLCYVTAVAFVFVLRSSTLVLAATAHYTTAQKSGSWVKSGDNYYWSLTTGSNLTNAFLDYDGETYYLASDGIMAKGWAKADGN